MLIYNFPVESLAKGGKSVRGVEKERRWKKLNLTDFFFSPDICGF